MIFVAFDNETILSVFADNNPATYTAVRTRRLKTSFFFYSHSTNSYNLHGLRQTNQLVGDYAAFSSL